MYLAGRYAGELSRYKIVYFVFFLWRNGICVFFLLVWKATLVNWCNFRNLSDCSTCYNTCLYPLSHYNQIAVDYFTKKSHHHVLQFQGYGLHCDFYLLVPSLLHLFYFSLLSKLLNLLEFYCFLFSYSSMWLKNCTVTVAFHVEDYKIKAFSRLRLYILRRFWPDLKKKKTLKKHKWLNELPTSNHCVSLHDSLY